MTSFKQLALIGPTASGKTALALALAQQNNANILSLDSLALYKEIDIASAKPNIEERGDIGHFGIDELFPNETFDVTTFIKLYQKAKKESIKKNKNLIIVGGTSFYLKSLIEGISPMPSISEESYQKTEKHLSNIKDAHAMLCKLDAKYMSNIEPNDHYRVEKMLHLFFETGLVPSKYFNANPPQATIKDPLPIYEISVDPKILRKRIEKRTKQMINVGLIDEVFYLEKTYARRPNSMKSIGIKEVLAYFDGIYTKNEMQERITIHTAQLAKRQRTFNRSQFKKKTLLTLDELKKKLLKT